MNKRELVSRIADRSDLSKAKAESVLSAFMDAISDSLGKGDSVKLIGFGTFSVSQREARKGRNPQTGAEIDIAARKIAKFKAGTKLNDFIS